MKIKALLVITFCLSSLKGFSQKGEDVIVSVIYRFNYINDLNKPDKPSRQEMILRLGKTESRYNNFTDEEIRKSPPKFVNSATSTSSGGERGNFGFVPTVFVNSKGIEDFDLIQYPLKKKILRTVQLGSTNYSIETDLPSINWKIYEEKKNIGGYTCQKAVGSYAGRNYTAWFAPALPFKNGPWKLSGLPGLILEAKDATGEVVFLFKELNKTIENESTAPQISRLVKVSEKAYERAKTAFEADPVSVYQTQLPIDVTEKPQLVFIDDKQNFYSGDDAKKMFNNKKKELRLRKNNPLELK